MILFSSPTHHEILGLNHETLKFSVMEAAIYAKWVVSSPCNNFLPITLMNMRRGAIEEYPQADSSDILIGTWVALLGPVAEKRNDLQKYASAPPPQMTVTIWGHMHTNLQLKNRRMQKK